ncbi:unnamed protein product, partial [Hapterophycus canaliculatus]
DETCSNGLSGVGGSNGNGNACCSLSCGQCGGPQCGSAPGGNTECCVNGVLAAQPDCSVSGAAPCIITTDGQFT